MGRHGLAACIYTHAAAAAKLINSQLALSVLIVMLTVVLVLQCRRQF